MNDKDFYEEIVKLITSETKYNRLYDAEVVELQNGKALCQIPGLGWNTNDKAAICTYSDKNSLTDYKVGDQVIVGFRVGSNGPRPFIVGMANDFLNVPSTEYNFNSKKQAVYDDRDSGVYIVKDGNSKELEVKIPSGWKLKIGGSLTIEINDSSITLGAGTKSFVLGEDLDTYLKGVVKTIFNAHTHPAPGGTTGAPSTVITDPVGILSNVIKGE